MPILDDIMDHDFLGPKLREAMAKGFQQGFAQGFAQGLEQRREQALARERQVLRRLVEKRFGGLPGWAESRLAAMPAGDMENLALRILDVENVDELFG